MTLTLDKREGMTIYAYEGTNRSRLGRPLTGDDGKALEAGKEYNITAYKGIMLVTYPNRHNREAAFEISFQCQNCIDLNNNNYDAQIRGGIILFVIISIIILIAFIWSLFVNYKAVVEPFKPSTKARRVNFQDIMNLRETIMHRKSSSHKY